jgi:hypothetical protein
MDSMRSPDCLRVHFRQSNAANLSRLHVLGDSRYRVLNRHLRVLPSAFKNVKKLFAVQQLQALINAASDVFFAAIGYRCSMRSATLDRKHDLVRIFRVFRKVLVEKLERVALDGAIEFTAVPELCTLGECSAHRSKGLLVRCDGRAPCEA